MAAEQPAGSAAAATQRAVPRTWSLRRNEEVVLQVWRVIANSGPLGIGFADISTRLNNMQSEALKQHLHELRRKGHIFFNSPNGSTRYGVWVATAKHPESEDPPLWQRYLGDNAPEHNAHVAADKANKVVAAAQQLPNSVFALGSMVPGFGVDIDAVHMSTAQHHISTPAAPLVAPLPAPELAQPKAADAATVAAVMEPQAAPDASILVALDSAGRLLVHEPGDAPVVLSAAAVRQLFTYLDRTLGCPGMLVEALP